MRWRSLIGSVVLVGSAAFGFDLTVLADVADPAKVRAQPNEPELLPPLKDDIAAFVNGVPILRQEVAKVASAQILDLRLAPSDKYYDSEVKKIQTATLEQIIERQLLVQEAKARVKMVHKENLLNEINQESDEQVMQRLTKMRESYSDKELDEFLRKAGTTVQELKRIQYEMCLAQEYLRGNVMPEIKIGPQQISDYYKAHPEEFRRVDSVEWQDIFIDAAKYPTRQAASRTANEIAAQARAVSSDDFVKLWQKYGNGAAKDRKAAGFGTHREDIVPPEAAPLLFQMHDGEVGPIVEVPAGFHVIRLVKRTHAGPIPLDEETQKVIKEKLFKEQFTREARRFIDDLKKSARIERYPF